MKLVIQYVSDTELMLWIVSDVVQVSARESVRSDVSSNDQRDAGERLQALRSSPELSFHGIRASGSARYRSSRQRSVISFLSSMEKRNTLRFIAV